MSSIPFDPSKFTVTKAKPLPVVLLLDISGSMSGGKIGNLNDAVRDMLGVFRTTNNNEIEIWVAVITFGSQVRLHQSLVRADAIQWHDLSAGGTTPLGVALQMAKAMIEDKDIVPSRAYRPTVVLVSDGQPDEGWESPLNEFIGNGRSAKCDRMAMAIGADADEAVLGRFIAGTPNPLFYAANAKELRDFFKFVTMSVTIRTKSQTPDVVPGAAAIATTPATAKPGPEQSRPATEESPDEDDGYW